MYLQIKAHASLKYSRVRRFQGWAGRDFKRCRPGDEIYFNDCGLAGEKESVGFRPVIAVALGPIDVTRRVHRIDSQGNWKGRGMD
jgi:hypothetical protein